MRVVFAGTPDFALPTLEMLLASRMAKLAGVFTQPPRAAGRGRKPKLGAVAEFLRAHSGGHDIPVFQPETFNDDALANLRRLRPELLVVVAYGLLLPAAALNIPRLGGVNLHASLLPRWRGAAPVERAIEAGDAETGVTLMQMDSRLDRGAILARARVAIARDDSGGSLRDKLGNTAAALLAENLDALAAQTLTARAQDDRAATYARKLQSHEAALDWRRSAAELSRRVRAFNPWPVAHAELDGARLRVLRAEVAGGGGGGDMTLNKVIATESDGVVGGDGGDMTLNKVIATESDGVVVGDGGDTTLNKVIAAESDGVVGGDGGDMTLNKTTATESDGVTGGGDGDDINLNKVTAAPGEIISVNRDGISVATGDGALILLEVQKPGGMPMPVSALLNGMRITCGMRFACARVLT